MDTNRKWLFTNKLNLETHGIADTVADSVLHYDYICIWSKNYLSNEYIGEINVYSPDSRCILDILRLITLCRDVTQTSSTLIHTISLYDSTFYLNNSALSSRWILRSALNSLTTSTLAQEPLTFERSSVNTIFSVLSFRNDRTRFDSVVWEKEERKSLKQPLLNILVNVAAAPMVSYSFSITMRRSGHLAATMTDTVWRLQSYMISECWRVNSHSSLGLEYRSASV